MKSQLQNALIMLVRAREDFQAMRKRMDNRLGLKANGEKQDRETNVSIRVEDYAMFQDIAKAARDQENSVEKSLARILSEFKVYNDWLGQVAGVGTIAAGWLLGSFDIEKATTVSKMWQYAGLNPSEVYGKIRVQKDDYKPELGEIIGEIHYQNWDDYVVQTTTKVRGDKPTKGFILPYNKQLRTALLGIIAPSFIKLNGGTSKNGASRTLSPYREIYDDYKFRLENSDVITNHRKKGETVRLPWKDVTKGHREMATRRYMMKQFIKDLYTHWRLAEGLEVRESYHAGILGHQHGGKSNHFKRALAA